MQSTAARKGHGSKGWRNSLSALPAWGWSTVYYVALLLVFRFLLYDYITDKLDRQLLGFSETLALSAVFFAYLVLCAIPPYLWSRNSHYHPIWRGIESFICYFLVALVLGAILAAIDGGEWSVLSGIAASGAAWARIGSIIVLFGVFIGASWLGGMSATARRKRGSRNRRKPEKNTAS